MDDWKTTMKAMVTGLGWGLLLMIGIAVPALGEAQGFAHRSGQLIRLDLDFGSGGISWEVLSATGLGGQSGALA